MNQHILENRTFSSNSRSGNLARRLNNLILAGSLAVIPLMNTGCETPMENILGGVILGGSGIETGQPASMLAGEAMVGYGIAQASRPQTTVNIGDSSPQPSDVPLRLDDPNNPPVHNQQPSDVPLRLDDPFKPRIVDIPGIKTFYNDHFGTSRLILCNVYVPGYDKITDIRAFQGIRTEFKEGETIYLGFGTDYAIKDLRISIINGFGQGNYEIPFNDQSICYGCVCPLNSNNLGLNSVVAYGKIPDPGSGFKTRGGETGQEYLIGSINFKVVE